MSSRSNVALNALGDRIVTHRMPAGDAAGVLRLYHVGDAPVTFSMGAAGTSWEEVPAARVDAVVPAADHPRVGFIKIDVEGFERTALEGARAILERTRPAIMFEVSAAALARSGMTPVEMYDYLATYGYRFHRFARDGALVAVEGCPEGNIFALAA